MALYCRYCGKKLKSGESEEKCPERPCKYCGEPLRGRNEESCSKKPLGGSYPSGSGWRECGVSCFPANTMILMGDNTEKPIEQVAIGEIVLTPFGPARVNVLDRPLLGDRPLYEMQDGRKLRASSEQSIWGRNPETLQEWWVTRDINQWRYEAENGYGSKFSPEPVDLTDRLGVEWEFATVEGWIRTTWKRVDAPGDLQLYDLYLDSGGAYFADGYLVKTFPDMPNEAWSRYVHKPTVATVDLGETERAVRVRPTVAAIAR